MKARIISYRRSRHVTHENQAIIAVEGVFSKQEAQKLVGKRVFWLTPCKKKIWGVIAATHGNNGALRARFSRGLPGQAVGTKLEIMA